MKVFEPKVHLILLLLAAPCSSAQAQELPAVLVDIAPCMAQAGQERMACYERLEASVRAAQRQAMADTAPADSSPTPTTVSTSPVEIPEPRVTVNAETDAVANFGVHTPEARVIATDGGEQELRDRIASLQEREPGRWLITLESGQVWYQTNSGRIRLRKGMDVRIYASPLGGSFRLAGTEGASTGFIQVRRVE